MRVVVEQDVFTSCESFPSLQRLFLRAGVGQHELSVPDPASVLDSDFFSFAVAKIQQYEWQELIQRTLAAPAFSTDSPTIAAHVSLSGPTNRSRKNGFQLAVTDVGEWAEQPLALLLENDRDWLLVKMMCKITDGKLSSAVEQRWLVPRGCGGTGELKKRIAECGPIIRVFVITDSDRETVCGPISPVATNLQAVAKANEIPLAVLESRELENYVPEEVWWQVVGAKATKRRSPGKRARRAHAWRRILAIVNEHEESLRRKHGADVLADIRRDLQQRAEQLAEEDVAALLKARREFSPAERSVDDLKARLGERITGKGLERFEELLENPALCEQLDEIQINELLQLAHKLESWL